MSERDEKVERLEKAMAESLNHQSDCRGHIKAAAKNLRNPALAGKELTLAAEALDASIEIVEKVHDVAADATPDDPATGEPGAPDAPDAPEGGGPDDPAAGPTTSGPGETDSDPGPVPPTE